MRSESESEFDEPNGARSAFKPIYPPSPYDAAPAYKPAYPASSYDAAPAYQPSYDDSYPAPPSYGGYGMIKHISKV